MRLPPGLCPGPRWGAYSAPQTLGHTCAPPFLTFLDPPLILGPLLFTLYINDLPSVTKTCKVILYADDTAIIYSDKQKEQIEKHLNDDMAIVKTWLDENKLTLNVKKTKSMLIGNKKLLNEAEHLVVRLDMDRIEQVGEFKYLEVWLDSLLKFTCHISKMSSKKNLQL